MSLLGSSGTWRAGGLPELPSLLDSALLDNMPIVNCSNSLDLFTTELEPMRGKEFCEFRELFVTLIGNRSLFEHQMLVEVFTGVRTLFASTAV